MEESNKRKCIIWGTGYFGEYIQDAVLDYGYQIIAYCDSVKRGKLGDYNILDVDKTIQLCNEDEGICIIIGVKNKQYVEEIKNIIQTRFPSYIKYEYGIDIDNHKQEEELKNFYLNMDYRWAVNLKTEFLIWLENIYSEIEYWVTCAADRRGAENGDLKKRRDNNSFLHAGLVDRVKENDVVLDIGCGLMSMYGNILPDGKVINLVPVDALAYFYNEINKKIQDGKQSDYKCRFGMFEFIANAFRKNYADAIIINNALDHCIDPYRSIVECLYTLKVNGEFHMVHRRAEAVYEKWIGLHRWNVDCIDGDLVLWNKENAINVSQVLSDYAKIEVVYNGEKDRGSQMVSVVITKRKDFELNQLLDMEKDTEVLFSCVEALMDQQAKYNSKFKQLLKCAQF